MRKRAKLHSMLNLLTSVERPGKPREHGLTIILDKLQPLDREFLDLAADFIDYAKIGWGMSVVAKPRGLAYRIDIYREYDIGVMAGGTLVEIAYYKGVLDKLLGALWEAGFDTIEVSSGVKIIPLQKRLRIIEKAARMGFRVLAEVGRKKIEMRMSRDEALHEIQVLLEESMAWKVVLEGREYGRGGCLYDPEGVPRRRFIDTVTAKFDPDKLIFEAPLPQQQAFFIRLLGPNVNLGNIHVYDVMSLESMRLGLRGDTLAIADHSPLIEGPPSVKFVYHVLRTHGILSTRNIQKLTGLPARTVYEALAVLRSKGLVDSTQTGDSGEKYWYAI